MNIDEAGLKFIRDNEGCVLYPYKDQAGNATIGIGHLLTEDDPDYSDGITEEEALEILAKDVQRFVDAVNSYNLDLTQGQMNALTDFAFNAGDGALHQLLGHGLDEVPNQLPRWVHAGGHVISALVNRRQREVEMWGG